jgi:MtN3 and saliva related transmembrane protein
MYPEILGHIGGAVIAFALLPQVIKSWKTKSVKDISMTWNTLMLTGLITFLFYGIGINSLPIIIFGSIEVSFTASLLVLKLIYGKK